MIRLESPRLILRPYCAEDLELTLALYGDPEVTRFTLIGRLDRSQAEQALSGHIAHWATKGLGLYALFSKEDEGFVGECGFFAVAGWEEPFLRYALLPAYRGRGLASEAVQTLLRAGFGRFALKRIMSVVEEPNRASHRIMRKSGFRAERSKATAKGQVTFYALTAEDWAQRRGEARL